MKRVLLAATVLSLTSYAEAKIPLVNATCPGNIEVHADEGGPIYINGKEGSLKRFNDNYYEAKGGGVTISLTIVPDGSPDVSYTGHGGANGVCAMTDGGGGSAAEACPADVSEADRTKYPACG